MTHRRRMGTGCIYRQDGRWVAYAPRIKCEYSEVVGHFAFYHQAEKAIDEWIKAHQQAEASQ